MRNVGGDILDLKTYHKAWVKKLVLEDHGGGGAGRPILHVRLVCKPPTQHVLPTTQHMFESVLHMVNL